MTGALSPTHWLIIAVVLVLLLGAKRLPDTARGLGKAMRIFKAETAALSDGDRPTTEDRDGGKQALTGDPGSPATERSMTVPSSTSSETAA